MKINITALKTELTPEIKKYTETKLNKLCKRYKQIQDSDVVLEGESSKKSTEAATVKILLKIKGLDISAAASAKTLFAAVDEVERKLIHQLDREKAKHDATKGSFTKSKALIRKIFTRNEQ
jgi:ribosomal subunit interface protein